VVKVAVSPNLDISESLGEMKGKILTSDIALCLLHIGTFHHQEQINKVSFLTKILPIGILCSTAGYVFHMFSIFQCVLFINMKHRDFKLPSFGYFCCFVVFFVLRASVIHGFAFVEKKE
jgi:hypothetical protein